MGGRVVMARFARAWDRFWFGPFDPLPAACLRISLGALIFLSYLAAWEHWDRFYAADGMLSLADPTVHAIPQGWWSVFWWTDGFLGARPYWWIGVAAALAFTLGWHTRLATIVLFVIQASLVHRNPAVCNGEDLVFRMLLFYACFAPLGAGLSLDARRQPSVTPRSIWPLRLMQINVALVYLISQPHKLAGDVAWWNGDAMYYVMVSRAWSRWPWPELFYWRGVASAATWGSLAFELAFPLLVWFRRPRPWIVVGMAAFHLALAVTLQNVTFFSLAMAASFWAFLTSDDLRRLGLLRHGVVTWASSEDRSRDVSYATAARSKRYVVLPTA
jgi:hypothetical protein